MKPDPAVPPGERGPVPAGAPPAELRLTGGIVAHNEELTVRSSIRSLLSQRLPDGVRWDRLWVVASGCTDATVDRVESLARVDPRVGLVVEPDRRGKAQALGEVFARATGHALVLLNGDAVAEPGAVAALLARAPPPGRPYAVMGRPVTPAKRGRLLEEAIDLQWELHHQFHLETLGSGRGNHLSDELLLVGLPGVPGIPRGIVNDGSYFGAYLAARGGLLAYAPEARVRVAVPSKTVDHLGQRRRIQWGHVQVARLAGQRPTTFPTLFRKDPSSALALLRRTLSGRPHAARSMGLLVSLEVAAAGLATWDRFARGRDHVRWRRIRAAPGRDDGHWEDPRRPEVS
jgi:hypothetical protein